MSRESELADKIIKELRDEGLNYDQILEIIKLARKKYRELVKKQVNSKMKACSKCGAPSNKINKKCEWCNEGIIVWRKTKIFK